jgi:hypothetical protein
MMKRNEFSFYMPRDFCNFHVFNPPTIFYKNIDISRQELKGISYICTLLIQEKVLKMLT